MDAFEGKYKVKSFANNCVLRNICLIGIWTHMVRPFRNQPEWYNPRWISAKSQDTNEKYPCCSAAKSLSAIPIPAHNGLPRRFHGGRHARLAGSPLACPGNRSEEHTS